MRGRVPRPLQPPTLWICKWDAAMGVKDVIIARYFICNKNVVVYTK